MSSLSSRIPRALRLAFALSQLALLWPPRARAESVVLLSPRGDQMLRREQAEAQRVLQQALQAQGVQVTASAQAPGRDGAASERCDALDCAAALVRAADADLAAAVSLWASGDPPSPSSVVVTLVDAGGDRFPGKARVERRGSGDLARAVKDALLDARALQLLGPGPWLRVHGKPEGAEVVLNGKPVGTVPYRAPIESGRHTLEVRSRGHQAHAQTVDVPPGAARQVDVQVELRPRDGAEDGPEANAAAAEALDGEPESGGGRPIVGPLILGGLGLAVIGADIALVLSSGCRREDSRGTCLEHRSINKAPALVIGGVGFAAIAAATLWHVLGGDSETSGRDTALRLAPDGVALTASF